MRSLSVSPSLTGRTGGDVPGPAEDEAVGSKKSSKLLSSFFLRLSLSFSLIGVPFSLAGVSSSDFSVDDTLNLLGDTGAGVEDGGASERPLARGRGIASESSIGSRILTRLSGGETSILAGGCGCCCDGGESGEGMCGNSME